MTVPPALPDSARAEIQRERAGRMGLVCIAIGCVVILGWILDVDVLKRIVPLESEVTMNANTAVCFILAGISLLLLAPGGARGPRRTAGMTCAGAVVVIAATGLLQYMLGRDLGVDELLFDDASAAAHTVHPGRMAFNTTIAFTLAGIGLMTIDASVCGRRPAALLGWLVVGIALLALTGYATRVTSIQGFNQNARMALPAIIGFVALGAAIALCRPERGTAALFASSGLGGIVIRRMLPVALLLPIAIGFLRLRGQEIGVFDLRVGIWLTVTSMIVLLVAMTWLLALSVERIDARRRLAAEAAEQASREAKRANAAKNEFLSRLSHELRTPLSAILGFGELLNRDALDPSQREKVGYITKGGRHLLDMINELLDISRIEAGELALSIEPVSVPEAIGESVVLIEPMARERGVGVRVQLDGLRSGYVRADQQRLKQVLLNLLSNAVKYNRAGGSVIVIAESSDDHRVTITVRDTGVGIAPERLHHIFDPFERVGAETSGVEGTGLGLAIARGMTEAMGGNLSVASQNRQGTTFTLEFDAALAPEHADDAPREEQVALDQGGDGRPGTILYIEDNIADARLVEEIFAVRPATQVVHASHGELGLHLARTQRPCLILLDLHLPTMPGDQVLDALKADPLTQAIPVVVLSADMTKGRAAHLIDLGAHAHLGKPIDISRLLEVCDAVASAAAAH